MAVAAFASTACTGSSSSVYSPDLYEGVVIDGAAPNFQLIDQNGDLVALSDFRGKVVALTFMDSQCEDVCPLTSLHLRRSHQMLGDMADEVVLLGINVNAAANAVEDVAAATHEWQLDEISTWHFLTGTAEELEPVWAAYHVEVEPQPNESGIITHTPGVYLIDRSGQQRWYVSTPFVEAGTPPPSLPLSELLTKHLQELVSES